MRFTRIVALFLTLAVPCAVLAQGSKRPRPNSRPTTSPKTPSPRQSVSPYPPPMTPEKAFYYSVAINGQYDGYIDTYGKRFDASNYERAMADEFERNRYRERIRARIADEVRKINFSEKFSVAFQATLGEYSFGSHSFPFEFFPDTGAYFQVWQAVNGNDYDWSVPMPETDASAFIKSRSTGTGVVNRGVIVRITYSVVKKPDRGEIDAGWMKWGAHRSGGAFIYSVEVFGDQSLTRKLSELPKTNSRGPGTVEEWRSATVAAQTPSREIGKYHGYSYCRSTTDGKLHNPLAPPPPCDRWVRTFTLTDAGVMLVDTGSDGNSVTRNFTFFDAFAISAPSDHRDSNRRLEARVPLPTVSLWRATDTMGIQDSRVHAVIWRPFWKNILNYSLRFEFKDERDRFFADLTHAIQAWTTKYASYQFASGKVEIYQQCETHGGFDPCQDSTLSQGKPVWQTPAYRVTVESLERNANLYTATLVFENLTDETISVGWEEKSNLLPDAVGPYLMDERNKEYFAGGTDSGNIIQSSLKWLTLTEIHPKTKLKSRFLFFGNGEGKIFTLEAKGIEELASRPITIDGLVITSPSVVIPSPPGTSGLASSSSTPVARSTDEVPSGTAQLAGVQLVFAGKEEFESSGRLFTRYKFGVSNRSDFPDAMFERAPDLPPCGRNANASRSWVDLYAVMVRG